MEGREGRGRLKGKQKDCLKANFQEKDGQEDDKDKYGREDKKLGLLGLH